MNTKFLASLTVTATTAIAVSLTSIPAQAYSFGTSGISFETDTTVNFKFVESHGAYTSAFSIFENQNHALKPVARLFWETKGSDNGSTNEYRGTFGNTVTSSTGINSIDFTFKAGVTYAFALLSGNQGTVYSTNSLNNGGTQQALFSSVSNLMPLLNPQTTQAFKSNPASYTSGNPFAAGGTLLSFDDGGGGNDRDFQDFTLQAQAVPEPLTVGSIALAGVGLIYARSRRRRIV